MTTEDSTRIVNARSNLSFRFTFGGLRLFISLGIRFTGVRLLADLD